jgi:acyl-homoserine-lactone acylase
MQEPVKALTQSFTRNQAKSYAAFRETMQLHTNSSNNTIFADADGHIALFYANFVPNRNAKFDWTKPVDGADTATEWHGVLGLDESPNALDPASGWIQNTNNWPFSAAGPNSLKPERYPRYMEIYGENQRGVHAMRVLGARKDFTLETLRDAAFDSWQPAFAELVPTLLTAYDALPPSDARKTKLADPIAQLRGWDYRWGAESVPTSLAVYWGEELFRRAKPPRDAEEMSAFANIRTTLSPSQKVDAFVAATDSLTKSFGTWKTPWGEINRFQRLTDDIVHPFDDAKPSIPVPFTTGQWGSLASFGTVTYPRTRKRYGTGGNSFVAVVEFGDSVRAKAVTAGGESGNPSAKHFSDQAARYAAGRLRDVYFYPSQLTGHTERTYHPGK